MKTGEAPDLIRGLKNREMTPAQAIKTCIVKAFWFSGRASPSEFWWFAFFVCGVGIASLAYSGYLAERRLTTAAYPILIWGAVFALPLFSAAFRRMQDAGFNGLWIIIPVILWLPIKVFLMCAVAAPSFGSGFVFLIFGPIWLILTLVIGPFLSADADPGPNRYGPNPNEVSP